MCRLFLKRIVLTILCLVAYVIGYGQLVSNNVFLKGKYQEVGIDNTGAFGSDVDAPAGYHPRGGAGYANNIGFISDPAQDGWALGTPNYIGDYFLPGGVPHEGWALRINGQVNRAWRNTGTGNFSAAPGSTLTLTGTNTSYETVGSEHITEWTGTMGTMAIKQTTTMDTNSLFFVTQVVLRNTGTAALPGIYYMRSVDPENEGAVPGGSYTVTKTITFQPTGLVGADNKCLVKTIGPNFPLLSYMGLGAIDCRAKAFLPTGGASDPAYDPMAYSAMTAPATLYALGASTSVNSCAGIVFNIGTVAAGDSAIFSYAYILKEAYIDSAFNSLRGNWKIDGGNLQSGDTITLCRGRTLDINITGGGAYIWGDWTPNAGLAYPSGRNNTITVQPITTTYTVIGTTTVCPESDTLKITIIPVGDTTEINQTICKGQTYDFNGAIKFEAGTYFQTFSTEALACDSVTRLNLTVNPTPSVNIQARETTICDNEEGVFTINGPTNGASYQWLRDGNIIAGATGTSYTSPALAGVYRVAGVSDLGCPDTSRGITLIVNSAATVDIATVQLEEICVGDTIQLSVNSQPGYSYSWSPEAFFRNITGARYPTVRGKIPESGFVTVTGRNRFGCTATDSIRISTKPCCQVAFPTVFSPNGDGLNDFFKPLMQPGQKIVSFQVFNRRGNLVFDNPNAQKGWDGTYEDTGDAAGQEVYFYRIVYNCTDGTVFEEKGDVTLLR